MDRPIGTGDYVRVKAPKEQRVSGRSSFHEFRPGLVGRIFTLNGVLTARVSWTYHHVMTDTRSGIVCCFPVDELEHEKQEA